MIGEAVALEPGLAQDEAPHPDPAPEPIEAHRGDGQQDVHDVDTEQRASRPVERELSRTAGSHGSRRRRRRVLPAEGCAREALEPSHLLGPHGRGLELEVEVRAARVPGGADEPDRLSRGQHRSRLDCRVDVGHVAIGPDEPVAGADRHAKAAAGIRGPPDALDDGVRERVLRRTLGCGDVDSRIVMVRVRGGDDAWTASDREDVAAAVRRRVEQIRRALCE